LVSPEITREFVNVKIPFFLIHGNHDAPAGDHSPSPCSLMAKLGYVNYFRPILPDERGKYVLRPVILAKDGVQIAVYGLGWIFGHSFMEMLRNEELEFERPDGRQYSILLIHQDRSIRNERVVKPEIALEKFCPWMDLVVWGHEHENRVDLEPCGRFQITQPGSTVRTQLRKPDKTFHSIAILTLSEIDHPIFESIPLSRPRPYRYQEIPLHTSIMLEKAIDHVREILHEMLDGVSDHPLVRLKITYEDPLFPMSTLRARIIAEFADFVANPRDFIQLQLNAKGVVSDPVSPAFTGERLFDIIEKSIGKVNPSLFSANIVVDALRESIDHKQTTAFQDAVVRHVNAIVDLLGGRQEEPITEEKSAELLIEQTRAEFPAWQPIQRIEEENPPSSGDESPEPTTRVLANEPTKARPGRPKKQPKKDPKARPITAFFQSVKT
jgi:double-strand break repair protein MRE11